MPAKITVTLDPAGMSSGGGRPIFNPLTALSSTAEFKSESAVQNMIAGVCPKCNQAMTTAKISNGDEVYWCANCCVASLMPSSVA